MVYYPCRALYYFLLRENCRTKFGIRESSGVINKKRNLETFLGKKSSIKNNTNTESLSVEQLQEHFKNMFGEQSNNQDNSQPDLNTNIISNEELDMEVKL